MVRVEIFCAGHSRHPGAADRRDAEYWGQRDVQAPTVPGDVGADAGQGAGVFHVDGTSRRCLDESDISADHHGRDGLDPGASRCGCEAEYEGGHSRGRAAGDDGEKEIVALTVPSADMIER